MEGFELETYIWELQHISIQGVSDATEKDSVEKEQKNIQD